MQKLLSKATEFPGLLYEFARGRWDSTIIAGDEDDVEGILDYLSSFPGFAARSVENWLLKKSSAERTLVDLQDLLEEYDSIVNEGLEEVAIKSPEFTVLTDKIVGLVTWSASFIDHNPGFAVQASTKYYVYTHVESDNGKVFYVGKGTGNRVSSRNRHSDWHSHVKNLGGKYAEKIVANNLTEAEALELEEELIEQYRETVVNKVRSIGTITIDLSDNI